MAPPVRKSILDRIRDDFASNRHLIEKEIISNKAPDAEIDLTAPVALSARLLGDYVNLDWQHRGDIITLMNRISGYADDKSRSRPLNIVMRAEPGSGKSHFIKCLAKSPRLSGEVGAVTFNMAGMQGLKT